VHFFSASAREKVEGAGGTCEEVPVTNPAAPGVGDEEAAG
jgi:hypothetical protein